MEETSIKGALESPDLTGNPPQVQSRLDACLASDKSHITPGQSGDHVKVVQRALRKIRLRRPELELPEIKDIEGLYGRDTIAAVLKYKSRNSIVRNGQPLDSIVGRMTLTSFDNDLLDRSPPVVITQDVLVHILGARVGIGVEGAEEFNGQDGVGVLPVSAFNAKINTEEYLKLHKPLLHRQWHGGQGPKSPVNKIVDFISSSHDPNGLTLVVGLSSGGPAVVEVGQALQVRPAPIRLMYMGILDGAFDNENDKRISAIVPSGRSENFFQSLSNFAGQEFHGMVKSCMRNVDFTGEPDFQDELLRFKIAKSKIPDLLAGRLTQQFLEKVHTMAIRKAYVQVQSTIKTMLSP